MFSPVALFTRANNTSMAINVDSVFSVPRYILSVVACLVGMEIYPEAKKIRRVSCLTGNDGYGWESHQTNSSSSNSSTKACAVVEKGCTVVWSKREQIRNWPLHIMALLHSLYFIIKQLENRLLLAKLKAAFQRVGFILSILSHCVFNIRHT